VCFYFSWQNSWAVFYLCTDINFHACLCTFLTGVQNQVILDPINTSLDSAVRYRLVHGVDIILFNPPYVPTSSDEAEDAQEGRTIEGSWAGGFNGMELTNVFPREGRAFDVLARQILLGRSEAKRH